jgi:hypothetical protein
VLIFGGLGIWAVLFGVVAIALAGSVILKAVTGRDLDPPHDGE